MKKFADFIKGNRKFTAIIVLAIIIIFHLITSIIWLSQNDYPPSWDFALHHAKTLQYTDSITSGHLSNLIDVDNYYPPLGRFPAAIAHILFGRAESVALLANYLWYILLIVSVFGIGYKSGGVRSGVFAAVFVAFIPYLYHFSRVYALVVPSTASVALAVFAIVYADGYRDLKKALFFGVAFGAAILVKWTGLAFILPAAIAAFFAKRGDNAPQVPIIKRIFYIGAGFATAFVVSAPWYLRHLANLIRAAKHTAVEAIAQGDPPVFTMDSFTYYLDGSIYDMGIVLFLVGVAALVYFLVRRRSGWVTILAWIVGSYLIMTLVRNKDYRFIAPMLPAFAVAFGMAFAAIKNKPFRMIAGIIGVIYAVFIFFVSSFGIPGFPNEYDFKPFRGTRLKVYTYEGPRREDWHISDILTDISKAEEDNTRPPNVCVVPNTAGFAQVTFGYYAIRDDVRAIIFAAGKDFPNFCDYVVFKTGDQGPGDESWNAFNRIKKREDWFEGAYTEVNKYRLPDGSVATLFKLNVQPNPEFSPTAKETIEYAESVYPALFSDIENAVIAYRAKDINRGWFEYIKVNADYCEMGGAFTYFNDRLPTENVEILLREVVLNPWAPEGELQVLRLRALSLRYTVSEAALADTLAENVTAINNAEVQPQDDGLAVDARYGNIPVSTVFIISDDGCTVNAQVKKVKIGGIPLLYPFPSYISSQIEPCIDRDKLRFDLGAAYLIEGPNDIINVYSGEPTDG
ncbi:MAG: phospholipid carrier-dependent glycosyltransferase [bacterium]|nr:phospholipid carrier-dependent glycosyltransferase [bacterium]